MSHLCSEAELFNNPLGRGIPGKSNGGSGAIDRMSTPGRQSSDNTSSIASQEYTRMHGLDRLFCSVPSELQGGVVAIQVRCTTTDLLDWMICLLPYDR